MRTLWKLVREIFSEAMDDRITGEAAKAAYYFFLSFFPAILALFAFTGLVGGDATFSWIMEKLRTAMPGNAAEILADFVSEISGQSRPGLLSFGIVVALWSASNVFAAITDGLNRMYDLAEGRAWWQRRLLAVVALAVALVLLSTGSLLLLAGPDVLAHLGLGLGAGAKLLRWSLAFVLLTLMMWLIYYLLPARDQKGAARQTAVGAVVGTALWVAVTAGFRFFISNFGSYDRSYGVVGAIMVLLLWLYLTALAILFGGEVAATLEQHADPQNWNHERAPTTTEP
jgi:membrane protein